MNSMTSRDFTLRAYAELLDTIRASGLPVFGVRDWHREQPAKGVLVRHDVDRRFRNSLRMARLEHENGVRTTYYFRMTRGSFDPGAIQEIHRLGHEIGYHYEDLSVANGNTALAARRFGENLAKLRALAPVETVAMHGRPFSKFDNRDLWKTANLSSFGVTAEALATLDYTGVYYFTDAGRSWSSRSVNLRDHVPNAIRAPEIATTEQLAAFVRSGKARRIAIVCHPERWDDDLVDWSIQALKDQAINSAKRVIRLLRGATPNAAR
jgi:hypothetical protein